MLLIRALLRLNDTIEFKVKEMIHQIYQEDTIQKKRGTAALPIDNIQLRPKVKMI